MRLYTLHTESLPNLSGIVARFFRGATILYGLGMWNGEHESTAAILIYAPASAQATIANLADAIVLENRQQAVLVSGQDVTLYTATHAGLTKVAEA